MENPYAAPQAEILAPRGAQSPLTWKQILLHFEGRIARRTFWGFSILLSFIGGLALFCLHFFLPADTAQIAEWVLYVPLIWCHSAVTAKRWHDRDRSGWFVLISFIPVIGGIWTLVECGCMRGTEGPNKYGEDPT